MTEGPQFVLLVEHWFMELVLKPNNVTLRILAAENTKSNDGRESLAQSIDLPAKRVYDIAILFRSGSSGRGQGHRVKGTLTLGHGTFASRCKKPVTKPQLGWS